MICQAIVANIRACALIIFRLFPDIQTQASSEEKMCVNAFAVGPLGWKDVLLAVENIRGEEVAAVAGQASVISG